VPAKPRILIAGAGPTGLTAALELTRRGFAPRIVDHDPGPTALSNAVGISPHSLDLLEPSGVTERLLAQGLRMRRVQARFEAERLATISLERLPHRFNFLLSLPQHDTERLMEETLAGLGGHVDWNTELTALRLLDGGARADLAGPNGPETAQFDYVFGADGPRSRVREAAGIAFEGYVHKRLWSIADAMIPGWPHPPDQAVAILHRNGDLGFIIPIGPGRYRTVSNTPETLGQIPGAESASVLQADTFHLPIKQARTYQEGPVYLGGDAAHVHSPIGARGMNLGIEDAAAFARRLAEDTLSGYTAERHPVGRSWIVLSERMLGAVQASNPLAVPLRNLALRAIGKLPALQQPMMRRVAGLRE
jgi:2-polyprenyl-6-methoxyphenol hydroxylase-like FAD-dependent oxidoreductase